MTGGEITVHPTGTCFEDCSFFFVHLMKEDRTRMDRPDFVLVHGICLLENGKEYSHAWIEEGPQVHCPGIIGEEGKMERGFLTVEKKHFYYKYQVQECTRYTFYEAIRVASKHKDMPPPWELRYRRLCRDWKEEP